MKHLRLPAQHYSPQFTDDLGRLMIAAEQCGYAVRGADLEQAYSNWSEANYCAGWLTLSTDLREVKKIIMDIVSQGHLEEV